jgi:hypothetical protein
LVLVVAPLRNRDKKWEGERWTALAAFELFSQLGGGGDSEKHNAATRGCTTSGFLQQKLLR